MGNITTGRIGLFVLIMLDADDVKVSDSHLFLSESCTGTDSIAMVNHQIMFSLDKDASCVLSRKDDCGANTRSIPISRFMRRMLVVLLTAGVLIIVYLHLPIATFAGTITYWLGQHKVLGGFIILPLSLIISVPLCLPSSLLEMLAGYIFGKLIGMLISLIGKTLGSILAFTLGRYYGRDSAGRYLEANYPTFLALSQTLQGSDWKPLLMFQLSSIPNVIKCYGLAITEIAWSRFAISTFITGIPHSALWATAGAETIDIFKKRNSQSLFREWTIIIVGTLLTVAAIFLLARYTRSHLGRLNKIRMVRVAESETQVLISHTCLVSLH